MRGSSENPIRVNLFKIELLAKWLPISTKESSVLFSKTIWVIELWELGLIFDLTVFQSFAGSFILTSVASLKKAFFVDLEILLLS